MCGAVPLLQGVVDVRDLLKLTEDDMAGMGMRQLQRRRLLKWQQHYRTR